MNVFQFRERLVGECGQFTRSFTRIKTNDIATCVDTAYASQRYWPTPLVQVNSNFKSGHSVEELVGEGGHHPECARIFRASKSAASPGVSLRPFKHQEKAISFAQTVSSYVLTTGTGSVKSLAYFIPIVDAILKARVGELAPRTRAIFMCPMNALANSQLAELGKFLGGYGDHPPVTVGRYTDQEHDEERQRLAANRPDILLTNFMMLQLLMTRQDDKDKAVIRNARGLRFLVLDELHAYRGRQAADVALPVLRVRELTYTAHDLQHWAADLGYSGPYFAWDPDRRARLYGLTRDELRYTLDPADVMGGDYFSETFRVLKNNDISHFGEYRTRRLVHDAWDQLAAGGA
ncbi:DEAD/DEAH box helicase [Candidatus Accumulibacter sp. ACC003]|uniref:DEAD/DEAH box helicase n=1 Tax=Candidatus Accumulibacter sp. ACC003 TaxID=2823334 RepID=UPI0025C19911|nr:DEAD/DEAH box helicase [Candidatus Accumulibacter sp. ACC003]